MTRLDPPAPNPFAARSLADLRRRTSLKWRHFGADVLPLWVAEMDAVLAEPIAAALRTALEIGDTGYPYGPGYAEAFADFAAERWHWHFDASAVAVLPDVMTGIVEMLKLVSRPGDPVIMTPPVYPPFYQFVEHMDRTVVTTPLTADQRLDLAGLGDTFARCTAGGRGAAMLLCSPQNPTGTVHTADELGRVAELARAYGVRVVVDEIHAPLTYPEAPFTPYLTVAGTENAIVVTSASKAWNLAGLKAALGIPGLAAVQDLARMGEEVSHGASHFGVIAHTAALTSARAWLDDHRAGLDRNRVLLEGLLAEQLPMVRYRKNEGTYLAWLDCRDLGLGDDPALIFLDQGRVALNSGLAFGSGGAGHARLNFATAPDIITEAVRRMAAAVERYAP